MIKWMTFIPNIQIPKRIMYTSMVYTRGKIVSKVTVQLFKRLLESQNSRDYRMYTHERNNNCNINKKAYYNHEVQITSHFDATQNPFSISISFL